MLRLKQCHFSNEVRSETSLSPFYDFSVSVSLTECYVYCTMCNIMLAVVIGNIFIETDSVSTAAIWVLCGMSKLLTETKLYSIRNTCSCNLFLLCCYHCYIFLLDSTKQYTPIYMCILLYIDCFTTYKLLTWISTGGNVI